jgi:hypothetical protein
MYMYECIVIYRPRLTKVTILLQSNAHHKENAAGINSKENAKNAKQSRLPTEIPSMPRETSIKQTTFPVRLNSHISIAPSATVPSLGA